MKKKVLFFFIPLYGHVNPNIWLLNKLCEENVELTIFCGKKFFKLFKSLDIDLYEYPEEVENFYKESFKNYSDINKATKEYFDVQINEEVLVKVHDEAIQLVKKVYTKLESLVNSLNPDYIFYDSLAMWGALFGEKLGIPYYIIESATYNSYRISKDIYCDYFEEVVNKELKCNVDVSNLITLNRHMEKKLNNAFSTIIKSKKRLIFEPNLYFANMSKELQIQNEFYYDKYKYIGYNLEVPKEFQSKEKKILITRGTLQDIFNIELLIKIVKSIKIPDEYKLIVTTGGESAYKYIKNKNEKFEKEVSIKAFINQNEELQKAEIMICHGGITGVKEAIFYNTPMIIYPCNFHCYQVGLAVEKCGVGVLLRKHPLDKEELNMAITSILSSKEYGKKINDLKCKLINNTKEINILEIINECNK